MEPRDAAKQESAEEQGAPRVDLNKAGRKTLATLPGIGPTLAARIVTYRDRHGPFLFEEDITAVPGIGPVVYDQLRDRVTVSIPSAIELAGQSGNGAGGLDPLTEEPSLGAVRVADDVPFTDTPDAAEESLALGSVSEPPDESVAAESPAPPPLAGEPVSEPPFGIAHHQPPIPQASPEVATTPPPEQRPETARRAAGGGWTWVWSTLLGALLGGIFGMILTLLVLVAVNGAVDMRSSRAVDELRGQLSGLGVQIDAVRGDVSTLQGDLQGLRQRVEVLSGLTARMEDAEAAVASLRTETTGLQEQTTALESSVAELGNNVDALDQAVELVQDQTDKAMSFFDGLRTLLQDVFGETQPEGSAPAAPAGGGL